MIIDKMDNILLYKSMVPNLEVGLNAIKQLEVFEEGKYSFEGGFYMIQKGETKSLEEGTFEAHRKYIDIQIVVDGSEEIAWADIKDLTTVIEYDDTKDAERFEGDKSHNILVSKDMFYIAFPHDAHRATGHTKEKHSYTKIVMKLPVEA